MLGSLPDLLISLLPLLRGHVGPLLFDGLACLLIHFRRVSTAFEISLHGGPVSLAVAFPHLRVIVGNAPPMLGIVPPRLSVNIARCSIDINIAIDVDIHAPAGPVGVVPAMGEDRSDGHPGNKAEGGRGVDTRRKEDGRDTTRDHTHRNNCRKAHR